MIRAWWVWKRWRLWRWWTTGGGSSSRTGWTTGRTGWTNVRCGFSAGPHTLTAGRSNAPDGLQICSTPQTNSHLSPTLHIHMCCKSAQLRIPSYHPLISVDTPRIHYFTYRYLYVCDITIDSEFQQLNALHLKCCPAFKMLRQFGLLKQMITFNLQE